MIAPAQTYEVAKKALVGKFATMDDVLSTKTTKAVVAARCAVIRALYAEGLSSTEIGLFLDRDHTTILYHLRGGRRAPTNG